MRRSTKRLYSPSREIEEKAGRVAQEERSGNAIYRMRFLIDTHCWLWLQTEPERFHAELLRTLGQPETTRYFSAASAWEIAIKHALGKLPLPEPPTSYVPERMRISGTQGLAITHAHALGVGVLPHHHRDPFDRLLVAQARIEGLTLITADPLLARYDVSSLHPRGN